ncbi:MAG: hypothetical protein SHS37scaffold145_73 [Phage 71_18]|nr:MAG: hypothetical protein SHS37scaffold145_73 [Phage 71_18]
MHHLQAAPVTREVMAQRGFGYRYRVRIEPALSAWRSRPGFRVVLERHWVHWSVHWRSGWMADEAAARKRGKELLDELGAEPQGRYL